MFSRFKLSVKIIKVCEQCSMCSTCVVCPTCKRTPVDKWSSGGISSVDKWSSSGINRNPTIEEGASSGNHKIPSVDNWSADGSSSVEKWSSSGSKAPAALADMGHLGCLPQSSKDTQRRLCFALPIKANSFQRTGYHKSVLQHGQEPTSLRFSSATSRQVSYRVGHQTEFPRFLQPAFSGSKTEQSMETNSVP